jgi:tRNA1(Val) A37 N6-methylase TrmN6
MIMDDEDIVENWILGRKISLYQPKKGYKVSIDAILLSAFAQPHPDSTVLDVGAGVGGVCLPLAYRHPTIQVTSIECQEMMVNLLKKNIDSNQMHNRVHVVHESIESCTLTPLTFDHVVTNPPYFEYHKIKTMTKNSPNPSKLICHHGHLKKWLSFCVRMLKPKGYLWMIIPTQRLSDVLNIFDEKKMGNITITPLWSKNGHSSHRLMICAQKQSKSPLELKPGIVVHHDDGSYTDDINDMLSFCD